MLRQTDSLGFVIWGKQSLEVSEHRSDGVVREKCQAELTYMKSS
jgi:hypothetical protein